MRVIIATRNRDKEVELKALLREFDIESQSLNGIDPDGEIPEIEETGSTLKENALMKARKIHAITGRPTIADDTGLEVDALGGAPGVFSARYAGEGCSYEANVKKLLSELENVGPDRRVARFKTVACFVDGKKELWSEGTVEGIIAETPRGRRGFGYDPVFVVPELGKTYAQLSDMEKNKLSHRGKAIRKLATLLCTDLVVSTKPS